jgi:hypothetical protein
VKGSDSDLFEILFQVFFGGRAEENNDKYQGTGCPIRYSNHAPSKNKSSLFGLKCFQDYINSILDIATSYGQDGPGVRIPAGTRNFLISKPSRPALVSTHPPAQ